MSMNGTPVRQPRIWPSIIVVSALAVTFVTVEHVRSPIHPLLAVWFLCVCPGMAFIYPLDIKQAYVQLTLGIALSLALDILVASAMVYLGVWSATGCLIVLMGLSLVGIELETLNSRRRRYASSPVASAPEP